MSEVVVSGEGKVLKEVNREIRDAVAAGKKVVVEKVNRIHGVAAGLRTGEVEVKGDVGDYAFFLMTGGKVLVRGNAGRFVCDNMTGGEVVIEGNAGYGAGMGMYGGTLVIKGNSGDYTGVINKNGTIIVGGNVGSYVGVYMVGGNIVILGNAGKALGDWIIRGNIFIRGNYESLGHNAKVVELTDEDKNWLHETLSKYGFDASPDEFKKVVPESIRPFYKKPT